MACAKRTRRGTTDLVAAIRAAPPDRAVRRDENTYELRVDMPGKRGELVAFVATITSDYRCRIRHPCIIIECSCDEVWIKWAESLPRCNLPTWCDERGTRLRGVFALLYNLFTMLDYDGPIYGTDRMSYNRDMCRGCPNSPAFYPRILSGLKGSVYEKYGFEPVDDEDEPRPYGHIVEFAKTHVLPNGKTVAELMKPYAAADLNADQLAASVDALGYLHKHGGPAVVDKLGELAVIMIRLLCRDYRRHWKGMC